VAELAPPRACGCDPELSRSVLFTTRDFGVFACMSCGALVAFHSEWAYPEHPKAELTLLGYRQLALDPTRTAWLSALPRCVPFTAPACFLAGATRVESEAELRAAEAQAQAEQQGLSLLARLLRVGVPTPLPFEPADELAPFQEVCRAFATPSSAPFTDLMALTSGRYHLAAELARDKLTARSGLIDELITDIRSGGKPACAASEALFHLHPTDEAARRALAGAIAARILSLCEQPFPEETEVSAHVSALLSLGADAAPARAGLLALSASKLFPLRSLLRDQVAKIERAIGG
jgi:hypothetical protein